MMNRGEISMGVHQGLRRVDVDLTEGQSIESVLLMVGGMVDLFSEGDVFEAGHRNSDGERVIDLKLIKYNGVWCTPEEIVLSRSGCMVIGD
jgi:hypothetical protein